MVSVPLKVQPMPPSIAVARYLGMRCQLEIHQQKQNSHFGRLKLVLPGCCAMQLHGVSVGTMRWESSIAGGFDCCVV
jgi:hypothetical protein